ncbi:MAG: YbaN family protein [Gemmataceae bacterium]|nr:YbaN family protein [Gemmataceae bacterium]MCI0740782.1 YbaN family protein [Gemmataceae bacterium]
MEPVAPPPELEHTLPAVAHGPRRWLYVGLGCFFVGLGGVGVFLPILPTTPFLLLASFFFFRSSPRLNRWLLRSRLFGPFLRDWQRHRAVSRRVKFTALTMIVLAVAGSAYFGDLSLPWILVLCALALIGIIVVLRLPVLPPRS